MDFKPTSKSCFIFLIFRIWFYCIISRFFPLHARVLFQYQSSKFWIFSFAQNAKLLTFHRILPKTQIKCSIWHFFFIIALVRQFFYAKFKWKELGSKVPFVPKMSNLNLWTLDVSRPNLVRFGTKFWTSCPHTQFSAYPVDSAFWLKST